MAIRARLTEAREVRTRSRAVTFATTVAPLVNSIIGGEMRDVHLSAVGVVHLSAAAAAAGERTVVDPEDNNDSKRAALA